MWSVGWNQPHDQLNASFEAAPTLEKALDRLAALKRAHPEAYVWARGDFYDVAARSTEAGDVGFVVCPIAETDSEPPESCSPYSPAEMLELVAAEAEIAPAEEECPTCDERRRGRYANRDQGGYSLFLCSTCGHWTETLPDASAPGRRSRRSDLAS
jgi:hypothetical protein